jgi:hypothetical protein
MAVTATSSQARPQKRATGSRAAESSTTRPRRRSPAKKATPATAAKQPAKAPTPATAAERPTKAPAAAKKLPAAGATARPRSESELVTWQEVPMPHVKVPVVHVAGPAARSVLMNVRWTARTVAFAVPRPKQLLYYGGVGVLAALGLLEWPVAIAAAAGVWVATHSGGRTRLRDSPEGEARATARPTAATAR